VGEHCWDTRGEALKAFNSIWRRAWARVEKECTKRPDRVGLIISIYMIGFEPTTAVPVLVFVNKDKTVARETQKIIKKSRILKDHPGFITALMDVLPTGDLVLVAKCSKASTQIDPVIGIEHAVYFDSACDIQSIGISLYVKDE
jgi:hypothetical protein